MSGGRQDLAGKLRPLQASLGRQLARADVLADMIRQVNASLDPDKVADAIVARASEWIPAPGWLLLAAGMDGRPRARQAPAARLTAAARAA